MGPFRKITLIQSIPCVCSRISLIADKELYWSLGKETILFKDDKVLKMRLNMRYEEEFRRSFLRICVMSLMLIWMIYGTLVAAEPVFEKAGPNLLPGGDFEGDAIRTQWRWEGHGVRHN